RDPPLRCRLRSPHAETAPPNTQASVRLSYPRPQFSVRRPSRAVRPPPSPAKSSTPPCANGVLLQLARAQAGRVPAPRAASLPPSEFRARAALKGFLL